MAVASAENANLDITVEFTGGLEMLFDDKTRHKLSIPSTDDGGNLVNVKFLVNYLCQHVMKDSRKDLFVLDGGVRPGILVLINDADWELEGEDQYQITNGDTILFVSTLHGG